jgi:hypothetical protein
MNSRAERGISYGQPFARQARPQSSRRFIRLERIKVLAKLLLLSLCMRGNRMRSPFPPIRHFVVVLLPSLSSKGTRILRPRILEEV